MAPVGAWPPLAPEGGPRPAPPELWEPLVPRPTRVACALALDPASSSLSELLGAPAHSLQTKKKKIIFSIYW